MIASVTDAVPAASIRTLREALVAAGPRPGASFRAPAGTVTLEAALSGTVLGPERSRLAGRSVMLVVGDQLAAACAMIDLDGLVGRLMVAPPDLNPDHIGSIVADAGIEAIVTDRDPARFPAFGPLPVHRCGGVPVPFFPDAVPRQTAWVLSTSGTAGAPKLVEHTLAALTGAIRPLDPAEPLVWGTFYDIRRYGGLQIFLRAVLAGCTLVLSAPEEPLPAHLARLAAAGITHLSGTPSHWRRLLMSAEARMIAPATVRLSGEIADQAVLDGLAETYPSAKVGHAYASTEAGVGFEVNDGREGFPAAYLERGEPCAMRVEDGSLRIRSPRLASRYLGADAPVLTDPDGFVDTGDIVEHRGDRLFFVGRRGGIINVGGLKVHPEEIEAVLNRHESVRMSLVRSRRSPITGAVVVAEVVLADGAAPDLVRPALMAACRDALPVHKRPALIRFVAALDVTPAGKLSRTAG